MELRNTNIITPVGLFVSCISSSQQFIIKAQNYARRDWDHLDAYFIFEPIRCLVIFNVFVSVNLMSLSHGMSRIGIPTVVPCRAMSCQICLALLTDGGSGSPSACCEARAQGARCWLRCRGTSTVNLSLHFEGIHCRCTESAMSIID